MLVEQGDEEDEEEIDGELFAEKLDHLIEQIEIQSRDKIKGRIMETLDGKPIILH